MEENIKFYLIDDERPILLTLDKIIKKAFPNSDTVSYEDGIPAWQALQKETSTQIVIISDINMPVLSGIQLLKKVKAFEALKDTYFMVITSNNDAETNIKALQAGADDFLGKPFSVDQLIGKLRSAVRYIKQNRKMEIYQGEFEKIREEMDKDVQVMHDMVKSFQSLKLPEYAKSLDKIHDSAIWIATQLAETSDEISNIEKAAELCFCGKLYLNDKVAYMNVMNKGMLAQKVMEDVPKASRAVLSKIRNYNEVDKIVYHIYENFDGTGIPEGKKSWEIPLGSRILRVCIDFEDLMKKNNNEAKTIEELFHEAKRLYDHRVVTYYDQYLGHRELSTVLGKKGREETVKIHELIEEMILSRNIVTNSGLMLMTAGTQLSEEKIERIRAINKSDPILGKIFIRTK